MRLNQRHIDGDCAFDMGLLWSPMITCYGNKAEYAPFAGVALKRTAWLSITTIKQDRFVVFYVLDATQNWPGWSKSNGGRWLNHTWPRGVCRLLDELWEGFVLPSDEELKGWKAMMTIRFLVTVDVPDDPSGRDVLVPNHRRIREEIQQFVESEYPDAIVDVQWLSRITQAVGA